MTLCLAWKTNGQIHLASDSRICFGEDHYVDIAIKIFSIPVKISSAVEAQTRQQTLEYNYNIGMCFSGSSTNAYLVKESINEVLQHLQYTCYADISMQNIAQLVALFHENTSHKICSQLAASGIAEFILGGYCPAANRIKVFNFSMDASSFPIRVMPREILVQDGIEFLGNGAYQAKQILEHNSVISKFKLLKQVINDPQVPSVGGNIQYGKFNDNKFVVYGVIDYEIDTDNQVRSKFCLRGTELYQKDLNSPLHISYPFISPFQQEIDEALNRRPE